MSFVEPGTFEMKRRSKRPWGRAPIPQLCLPRAGDERLNFQCAGYDEIQFMHTDQGTFPEPSRRTGFIVDGPYSVLRASTGLMDAARRAGIIAATAAQIPSVIIPASHGHGLSALIP
jgi:hypothetical protein